MARKRLPEVLSSDEQERLLNVPNPRYFSGERNKLLIRLMLDTGLRLAESCALQWRDLDLNTGKLHVKQGKGAKDRILWLGEDVLAALQGWRERQARDVAEAPNHVFTTLEGKPLQHRYVRAMLDRYSKRAGIRHVNPHMLRHTFATDLLRQCANVELVRKALGHSNLSTTQIYTHLVDADLEAALKSFRTAQAVAA